MRINKVIITFLIFSFSWFMCINSYSAPNQNDPVALLQYISDNMITGLKANKATLKAKPQIVYSLAYKYVVPYADLSTMSKHVLPPSVWRTATPAERAQFEKEFTTTVIRTYASALTNYQDQAIRFFPVRGGYQGSNTVVVKSEISSSASDTIRVSYRLTRVGKVWRIYDMSVEGVSLIESFRSQFSDILASGNMGQLLKQLSAHNRR